MRFAVDARELEGTPTGVGRVLSGVLDTWPGDDELLLYARSEIHGVDLRDGWAVRICPGPSRLPGSVWEQTTLPNAVRRDGVDALFSPAYGMPVLAPCPTVVGMHDCASEALPQDFRTRERWRRRMVGRAAGRRAAHVLVGSEFAADEVKERLGVPASRVTVAPYGVSPRFGPVEEARVRDVRDRYGLGGRVVLFVGARLPRRGLPRLVETVSGLAGTRDDVSLCLAGPESPSDDEWRRHGESLGDRLRFLGFVPDDDLPALYAAATVLAYPSSYEGFGLPVLESLACGTPVVASDVGALREVFGGRACLVPHEDGDAWSAALASILDDDETRNSWIGKSVPWARERTWDEAARIVRGLMADAAGSAS